jgi:hypothetical protein
MGSTTAAAAASRALPGKGLAGGSASVTANARAPAQQAKPVSR